MADEEHVDAEADSSDHDHDDVIPENLDVLEESNTITLISNMDDLINVAHTNLDNTNIRIEEVDNDFTTQTTNLNAQMENFKAFTAEERAKILEVIQGYNKNVNTKIDNLQIEINQLIENSNRSIFSDILGFFSSLMTNAHYLLLGTGVLIVVGGVMALYFSRRTDSSNVNAQMLLTQQSNAITQALLVQTQAMNQHQPVNITVQQPQKNG